MFAERETVLYEWNSGEGYLSRALFPEAQLLDASPDDDVNGILKALSNKTRFFLPHLNCTHTARFPKSRAELLSKLSESGIRVLNGRVVDISKSTIQRVLLASDLNTTQANQAGHSDEVLIVKTDLNFAGKSEWSLSEDQREELDVGMASDIIWDPYHYRVVPRGEIPDEWWMDRRLVIERFISNRDQHWYRAYLLLGRVFLCEFECSLQIKKVGESSLTRVWKTIKSESDPSGSSFNTEVRRMLDDLSSFVQAFQIDFGTIDIVRDDEWDPYIIDVNSTPAYNIQIDGLSEFLSSR